MTINLYTASVPQFKKMLLNARSWMDKAQAHAEQRKFDAKQFMTAKLAPDMFPFGRQIQASTDHARHFCARVAGVDLLRFEDNEQTFAELHTRIEKTVAFLDSFKPEQLLNNEAKEIVYTLPNGTERKFPSAEAYFSTSAMPNFWFHITTAYAILREGGVEVGKMDYMMGWKG